MENGFIMFRALIILCISILLSACSTTKYSSASFAEKLEEKGELIVSTQTTNLSLEKHYINKTLDKMFLGWLTERNVKILVNVKYDFYYNLQDIVSDKIVRDDKEKRISLRLPELKYKINHIPQDNITAVVDGFSLDKADDIQEFMETYFDDELTKKGHEFLNTESIIELSKQSFLDKIGLLKPSEEWSISVTNI